MENKISYEGFFIDDEHSFEKGRISALFGKCKEFAKLVGKKGSVHIIQKKLSLTDKAKLFLITRYLGGELARIEPALSISKEIAIIHSTELANFLSVSEPNARTRMSDLIAEGFARKPKKACIQVLPHRIDDFLEYLNNKNQKGISKKATKVVLKVKKARKEEKTQNVKTDEVVKRLSVNLDISEKQIKDSIFIKDDGNFKFNKHFKASSKLGKQIKCALCAAFVTTVGLGHKTFSSRLIKKVCYHSNIDVTGLNYAVRELKNRNYITKAGRRSQDNIILEGGKKAAKKIFDELLK